MAQSWRAAAGAGSASGGMISPLIFGVQRYTLTSGLAVGASRMQASVGTSMGWATGELSVVSTGEAVEPALPQARRRRLLRMPAGTPAELIALVNVLLTTAVAVGLVVALQLVIVLLWRHVVNRRYYASLVRVAPRTMSSSARHPAPWRPCRS